MINCNNSSTTATAPTTTRITWYVGAPGQEAGNSRTVYLGNLPNDLEPHELLDYVRSGIIENVRIIPGKIVVLSVFGY